MMNNLENKENTNLEVAQRPVYKKEGNFNSKLDKKYKDPKNQLNSLTYSVFKKERFLYSVYVIFWSIIFVASLIGVVVNHFLNTTLDYQNGLVWYFLLAPLALVSLFFMIKYGLDIKAWKRSEKIYRANVANGQVDGLIHFNEKYKKLILANLRRAWLFAIFVTYFLLFNLVVFGLWKAGNIDIVSNNADSPFQLNLHLDLTQLMDQIFKDTKILLIVNSVVLFAAFALYFAIFLYNKNRIENIKTLLGPEVNEIVNTVYLIKQRENRSWIIAYTIMFALIVLLPLTILIVLLFKKTIRRKK